MKRYRLYLNGQYYGNGCLHYINELIESYVIGRQLHGRHVTEFMIEEV